MEPGRKGTDKEVALKFDNGRRDFEVKRRLQRPELEAMVRHLIRVPSLFRLGVAKVPASLFDREAERHLRMVWHAATTVADGLFAKALPDDPAMAFQMVAIELESRLEHSQEVGQTLPVTLTNDMHVLFGDPAKGPDDMGLVGWIFGRSPLDAEYGQKLLQDFLRERTVDDRIVKTLQAAGRDNVIVQLPAILADVQQSYYEVRAIGAASYESAFPTNYQLPDLNKSPTCLDWMDELMNGGDAPGEVYGILGPYASGKTVKAVQMAWAKALYFQSVHAAGSPLRHAFLFHYEAGKDEMRLRAWSHAARIHKDSLESPGTNYSNLSRRGCLKAYERELFKIEIARNGEENVDGEYERLHRVGQLMNVNFQLSDRSGTAGTGLVDEIAAVLEEAASRGHTPGAVYIDYVLLACRKHCAARGLDPSKHMRHLVGGFPDQVKAKIADRYKVPVWLFHQLNATRNSVGFSVRQHGTDAAEAKNFPENLWFCFELSTLDRVNDCVRVSCSKARRAPGTKQEPLLYLRGKFATFERAHDLVIDRSTGMPVPKKEVETLADRTTRSTGLSADNFGQASYDATDKEFD